MASSDFSSDGAADGGENHREDDDKRERGSGDVLEPGELRHEGVNRQKARTQSREKAIWANLLGDEKVSDLGGGQGKQDDHQNQKPDAGDVAVRSTQ